MSFVKDVLSFEHSRLKNIGDKLRDKPEQLLIGAGDEFGAKAWSGVTGRDYQPLVDRYGGATKDDAAVAQSQGVNTGPGKGMHTIARTIVNALTMKYAAGKLGGGAAGSDGSTGGVREQIARYGGVQPPQPQQQEEYTVEPQEVLFDERGRPYLGAMPV